MGTTTQGTIEAEKIQSQHRNTGSLVHDFSMNVCPDCTANIAQAIKEAEIRGAEMALETVKKI